MVRVLHSHKNTVYIVGCNSSLRYRGPIENCLLHWAAFNRSKKCLAFFLGARRLGVDTRNAHGTTALHVAAMKGYIDIMQILIQYGADVSTTTSDGDNSLHLALIEGEGQIVRFLLERRLLPRACLNQENMNGCTPLTIAAEKCDQESTVLLITAGALPYRFLLDVNFECYLLGLLLGDRGVVVVHYITQRNMAMYHSPRSL